MTTTQSIDLAIRAARLIKVIVGLIGVKDKVIASLIVNEAVREFRELAEFVSKVPEGNGG